MSSRLLAFTSRSRFRGQCERKNQWSLNHRLLRSDRSWSFRHHMFLHTLRTNKFPKHIFIHRRSTNLRLEIPVPGRWRPILETHFGIGPRGAKMGPRGPSRTSKYRKPASAKALKNNLFFNILGGPRPSKTASEDPKRLSRGYLGLLGAILSLGPSWKQELLK